MKKVTLFLITLICVITCVLGLTACGDKETLSYNECKAFDNVLGLEISGYSVKATSTNISGNIDIPATYNGMPVIAIAPSGFKDCNSLTSIQLPSSIREIGEFAFLNCSNLDEIGKESGLIETGINLPDKVTTIGRSAFKGCSNLLSVNLPLNVISIGNYAFAGCTSLSQIDYNAEDCKIDGREIFDGSGQENTGIHVNIGSTVKDIPNELFNKGHISLVEFASDINLKCIGNEFDGTAITEIALPESVTSIDNNAFYNCKTLTGIIIGVNINHIGKMAFAENTAVYFKGTKDDRNKIETDGSYKIYCYSKDKPIDGGLYWHYDEQHSTINDSVEDVKIWNE